MEISPEEFMLKLLDPFAILPNHVLQYLDMESILQASLVSKSWLFEVSDSDSCMKRISLKIPKEAYDDIDNVRVLLNSTRKYLNIDTEFDVTKFETLLPLIKFLRYQSMWIVELSIRNCHSILINPILMGMPNLETLRIEFIDYNNETFSSLPINYKITDLEIYNECEVQIKELLGKFQKLKTLRLYQICSNQIVCLMSHPNLRNVYAVNYRNTTYIKNFKKTLVCQLHSLNNANENIKLHFNNNID